MDNELISRSALQEELKQYFSDGTLEAVSAKLAFNMILRKIDNAPTVKTYCYFCGQTEHGRVEERPQGYFDMSKLRLMTVEECAGHTIDYAMGWKACIEWIKKGGAK